MKMIKSGILLFSEAERVSPAPHGDGEEDGEAHHEGDLDRSSMGELPLYESCEEGRKYNHDGTGLNIFLLLGLIGRSQIESIFV